MFANRIHDIYQRDFYNPEAQEDLKKLMEETFSIFEEVILRAEGLKGYYGMKFKVPSALEISFIEHLSRLNQKHLNL